MGYVRRINCTTGPVAAPQVPCSVIAALLTSRATPRALSPIGAWVITYRYHHHPITHRPLASVWVCLAATASSSSGPILNLRPRLPGDSPTLPSRTNSFTSGAWARSWGYGGGLRLVKINSKFWIPPYVEGVPARRGLIGVRCPTLKYFDTCGMGFFLPSLRAVVQGSDQRRGLRRSAERRTSRPEGRGAQDLLKKALPFLNISGRQVPWGNAGRNAEVTKLMAEHRRYGPGSHYANLAPGDVQNPSAVRL